jgi:hypothetical protein
VRLETGQPAGRAVEDDDPSSLVGYHHPVRKLIRENQAADRDRTLW